MSQITSEPSQAFLVDSQTREKKATRSISPLVATLWKDAYQAAQAVGAVCVGLLACQLLMYLVGILSRDMRELSSGSALLVQPSIAPFLVILACAGLLIGHERQTRTAEWHSSLPGSWKLALASKLFVTIGSAILTPLPMLILPFLTSRAPVGFGQIDASEVIIIAMIAFWALNVVVWMFLFTQLIDESLWAIVAGGIFLAITQILIGISLQASVGWERQVVWHESTLFWFEITGLILVGSIATSAVFRWRWGSGQRTVISLVDWLPARSAKSRVKLREVKQPSQFGALFKYGRARATKYVIGCAIILGLGLLSANPSNAEVFATTVYLSIILLGVATFDGDHVLGRSRFWADRGVSVAKFLLAKVLATAVPLIVLTLVACIGLAIRAPKQMPSFYLVLIIGGTASYLLACLYSLACKRAIVAITMTIISTGLILMIHGLVFSFVYQADWLAVNTMIVFAFVAIPALVVVLYYSTQRWILELDAKLFGSITRRSLSICLIPVFLAATLSFLFIRSEPWQGHNVASYQQKTIEVYDLAALYRVTYDLETTGLGDSKRRVDVLVQSLTGNGDETASVVDDVAVKLKEINSALSDNGKIRLEPSYSALRDTNAAIVDTVALSLAYLKLGRFDDARVALQIHQKVVDQAIKEVPVETAATRYAASWFWLRELRELSASKNDAEYVASPLMAEIPQSAFSMNDAASEPSWFTEEALKQVADVDELVELLVPQRLVTIEQRREWLKGEATVSLAVLTDTPIRITHVAYRPYYSWLTRNFPPLRWREERKISLELSEALEAIRTGALINQQPEYLSLEIIMRDQQARTNAIETERLLRQLLAE